MALGFRLTRSAQQDLSTIRRHSTQTWGKEQAKKYLQGMRETIELLAEFPRQGTARQDIGEGVFSFPYGSHWLFYRIEKEQLVIFAVLHQRMVPMQHLAGR